MVLKLHAGADRVSGGHVSKLGEIPFHAVGGCRRSQKPLKFHK